MTYNNIADMAADNSLQRRVMACAWQESVTDDPGTWAVTHNWVVSAQPGWADAWASAQAAHNTNPGGDEGVITDGMILSAVQALNTPSA